MVWRAILRRRRIMDQCTNSSNTSIPNSHSIAHGSCTHSFTSPSFTTSTACPSEDLINSYGKVSLHKDNPLKFSGLGFFGVASWDLNAPIGLRWIHQAQKVRAFSTAATKQAEPPRNCNQGKRCDQAVEALTTLKAKAKRLKEEILGFAKLFNGELPLDNHNISRDYDTKVTLEEVTFAAMHLKDTLGKVGIQEFNSSLSKGSEYKEKDLESEELNEGFKHEEKDLESEEFHEGLEYISNYLESEEFLLKDLESQEGLRDLYDRWRALYPRKFRDLHEKQMRFNVFKKKLKITQEINRMNLSYKVGLNKFSDWTEEEFESINQRIEMEIEPVF